MKGIIGRKAGMTSVFTDHGKNIPVSVIEVEPNIVTNILTEEKNGYKGIQLAAFDRRDKTSTKPLIGHFKKAKTNAKRFVREIRNMEGYELGSKVDASIFVNGQLVDVTGTSKGHGFQGTIKRHNQKIGPKSHGGGGGSQPTRQVGSIGDVSSNRVFKGMTMPGQMGNTQVTVQNLEVVSIDPLNNLILVKGSIPGPNKGFVVIKDAVKGLPSKDAIQLVNVKEVAQKNALLEEAKKWGADVNTEMTLEDMKAVVHTAKKASEAEKKAKEEAKAAKKPEPKAEESKAKSVPVKEAIEKEQSAEEAKNKVEVAKEKPKAEEAKAEEPKAEEAKAEEPKAEEPKAEEAKAEEAKAEEAKAEEAKAEEAKAEEAKTKELKVETDQEESKKETKGGE